MASERQKIEKAVNILLQTLCKHYKLKCPHVPVKMVSSKVYRAAASRRIKKGTTDFRRSDIYDYVISVNKRDWEKLDMDVRLEILTHEVCHIVQYIAGLYAKYTDPHNEGWKALMKSCGYKPRAVIPD